MKSAITAMTATMIVSRARSAASPRGTRRSSSQLTIGLHMKPTIAPTSRSSTAWPTIESPRTARTRRATPPTSAHATTARRRHFS